MVGYDGKYDEVASLLSAMADSGLGESQRHRLAELVAADPELCEFYLAFVEVDTMLAWEHGTINTRFDTSFRSFVPPSLQDVCAVSAVVPPPFPLLSTTLPGTAGFFSSGWLVAYLVATVICGVSMLVGSLMPVSQPVQVARQSSAPSRTVAEPQTELVGRITGMVDCRWAENPKSEIRNPKQIETSIFKDSKRGGAAWAH